MMKLQDPMLHGPQVKRLQEALRDAGFGLGIHGADGWYGEATARAVRAYQRMRHLTIDGIAGPATLRALGLVDDEPNAGARKPIPGTIIDRSGKHRPPELFSKRRSPRTWSLIRGVTLHQTGILISERHSRWDTLNAHIAVLRSGEIIVCNALDDFIWHAQGLSHGTIGIEFNGNFEGVEGKPHTAWRGGGGITTLTEAQLAAADVLFGWLQERFALAGATWDRVHAHRQSASSRRGDPGSEIWQKVGLVWLQRLRDGGFDATDGGPGWSTGEGRPIPREWDPAAAVRY